MFYFNPQFPREGRKRPSLNDALFRRSRTVKLCFSITMLMLLALCIAASNPVSGAQDAAHGFTLPDINGKKLVFQNSKARL